MSARVAVLVAASVTFLALFGYLGAGLIYGKVLLDNAGTALGTAVADQKVLAPQIDSLKRIGASEPAVTEAEVRQQHADLVQQVAGIENARTQVESDDQSLAEAGAPLDQDRWLTPLARSALDRASRRIGLERKVLADARMIIGSYAQSGEFYISFSDIALDFYAILNAAKARDVDATELALGKLQVDTAKAMSLDKTPGLPPEVDAMMRQLQKVDADFVTLFRAALARNRSAVEAAQASGWADIAKLQAIDLSHVAIEVTAFYSPLVDAYFVDVGRAAAA